MATQASPHSVLVSCSTNGTVRRRPKTRLAPLLANPPRQPQTRDPAPIGECEAGAAPRSCPTQRGIRAESEDDLGELHARERRSPLARRRNRSDRPPRSSACCLRRPDRGGALAPCPAGSPAQPPPSA